MARRTRRTDTDDSRFPSRVVDSMREEVQREIHRSRRYGRPFALIRFATPEVGNASPRDLPDMLRLVDRAWMVGDDAWAMLPETGAGQVIELFERLHREAPTLLHCPASIAMYPEQAATLDELFAIATSRVDVVVLDRVAAWDDGPVRHVRAA